MNPIVSETDGARTDAGADQAAAPNDERPTVPAEAGADGRRRQAARPPPQMGRLRDEDFRLDEPIPYVAVPRGKGGRIAAVPLVP